MAQHLSMDLFYVGTIGILQGTSQGVFIFTDGFKAEGLSEEVLFHTGVINHGTLASNSMTLLTNIHLEQKHTCPLFMPLLMLDAPASLDYISSRISFYLSDRL